MRRIFHSRPRGDLVTLACLVIAVAAWVLFTGETELWLQLCPAFGSGFWLAW